MSVEVKTLQEGDVWLTGDDPKWPPSTLTAHNLYWMGPVCFPTFYHENTSSLRIRSWRKIDAGLSSIDFETFREHDRAVGIYAPPFCDAVICFRSLRSLTGYNLHNILLMLPFVTFFQQEKVQARASKQIESVPKLAPIVIYTGFSVCTTIHIHLLIINTPHKLIVFSYHFLPS